MSGENYNKTHLSKKRLITADEYQEPHQKHFKNLSENVSHHDKGSDNTDDSISENSNEYTWEIEELKKWIVKCEIPYNYADELLKILRSRLLPNLPERTEIFLQNEDVKPVIESNNIMNESPTISKTQLGLEVIENIEDGMLRSGPVTNPEIRKDAAVTENNQISLGTINLQSENTQNLTTGTSFPLLDLSTSLLMNMEIENVQCSNGFETAVMHGLSYLQHQVTDLKNYLIDKKVADKNEPDLEKKYSIKLPLQTLDEFLDFDKKLSSDDYLKADILTILKNRANVEFVSKSISAMLKKFLTKDLASQFTAVRKSRTKLDTIKFKETELWNFIKVALASKGKNKNLEVKESEMQSKLSDVLTNVRTW